MHPFDMHLARALADEKRFKRPQTEPYVFANKFNLKRQLAYLLKATAEKLEPSLKTRRVTT